MASHARPALLGAQDRQRAQQAAEEHFPAEHWKHLRTTNVIESSFATVRHRSHVRFHSRH
jgi:transposase-like protein